MSKFKDLPTFYPPNRAAWRNWLAENHTSQAGIWLIYYKKSSGQPTIAYAEAVEEALCYGWIDTTIKPVDAQSYKQLFVPRKPTSTWSKVNKERLEKLFADNLMTEAGLKTIEVAKANGSWTSLDAVENLEVPPDLEQALRNQQPAWDHFQAFSRTGKKSILYWLTSAKRPDTRQQRLNKIVELAVQNIAANESNRK